MNALETWIAFTAAWLQVGFGLFIAMRSIGMLRGAPMLMVPVITAFVVVAFGLVALGLVAFVRVVPW